jgi:hypothetical protein
MKKLIWMIFLFNACLSYAQQSEVRTLSSFRGVKVGEAIDVYLKKGEKETARLETTGVSPADVITEVIGGNLKIHMRDGNYRNSRNVKVYVTYVDLERISSSSAANVFSDGVIKAKRMYISTSSAGSIEINLDADEVTIDVSSAGDATLEGRARLLTVEASSAGSVDAYSLDSEQVDVSASSTGSVKVTATKEIEAKASSGGSVRYRGNPARSNINSSSGGSVKKSS